MTNAQSKELPYVPPCFKRTQEIALIINIFLNNIDLAKKIINIFKKLEFEIAKEIYNDRYCDFEYCLDRTFNLRKQPIIDNFCRNSIYWKDIDSNEYNIFGSFYAIRPVTLNYEIAYHRGYNCNFSRMYPKRVDEVNDGLDRFILHICIKTLQGGFINYYDDSMEKYTVKDKINWINQKILRIYTNSWITWTLNTRHESVPFPFRYQKMMWPLGFYETHFDDITNSHNIWK